VLDFVAAATANLTNQVSTLRVFFYTHSPTVDLAAFPDSWTKRRLENVGRESYAYVNHIVDTLATEKVHTMADHVWFSQAAPQRDGWNKRSGVLRRLQLLGPHTGMLALGLIETANCQFGGSFSQTEWRHVRDIYVLAQRRVCEGYWVTFMNGEFIVSKKRILHQPLWLWKYLRELLEAPLDHFIHKEGTTAEKPVIYESTRSDPIFGHMMVRSGSRQRPVRTLTRMQERLWNPLLNCLIRPRSCCSDETPDVPCQPGDCQCLDE